MFGAKVKQMGFYGLLHNFFKIVKYFDTDPKSNWRLYIVL